MSEVSAEVIEATWMEVASVSDSRGRKETKRAQREQTDLFEYVLGATQHLSPDVHALGFYVFFVIWQAFERAATGRLPRVTAGAIGRRQEENEQALLRIENADGRFFERAMDVQTSREPAVFRYMIEAVMAAPNDPDDPVEMTGEERGTLILVLQVAIDVLHDACEKLERPREGDPPA